MLLCLWPRVKEQMLHESNTAYVRLLARPDCRATDGLLSYGTADDSGLRMPPDADLSTVNATTSIGGGPTSRASSGHNQGRHGDDHEAHDGLESYMARTSEIQELVAAVEESLLSREDGVDAAQAALQEKESEVSAREEDLARRETAHLHKEAALERRERVIARKELALGQQRVLLAEEAAALGARAANVRREQSSVAASSAEIRLAQRTSYAENDLFLPILNES